MLKRYSIILGALALVLPITWTGDSMAEPSGLIVAYDLRFDSDEQGYFLNVSGNIRNNLADKPFPLTIEIFLDKEVDGDLVEISTTPATQTVGQSGTTFQRGNQVSFNTYFDLFEIGLEDIEELVEGGETARRQLQQELEVRFRFSTPSTG